MDSLVNYASDGENSDNSIDTKMFPEERAALSSRRASDANYDPVQMDMSEESNNNHSSNESGSEHGSSPLLIGRVPNVAKRDSPPSCHSPPSVRRSDHENNSSNAHEESKRSDRSEKSSRHSSEKSRRSSYDDRGRRGSDHRDSKDLRKSRDDDRRSRDDDRRRERDRVSSSKEERDKRDRDDRRDRERERDRDRGTDKRRDRDRDRDRRHSKDDRSKDRHRDERSSYYHKERDRTRSRSRSRDRNQSNYRSLSYREEKNRNKLAQLEKLGIELKSPEGEAGANNSQEPNYYNPLATATQGKYAEQIQKRKLLWANKKPEEGNKVPTTAASANTWVGTTFTHDQDGKVTAKFKRLMGIKGDLPPVHNEGSKPDILKKQEEMFSNMEQQYEVARATTHTQRGVGLGYASGAFQFPR